MNALELKNLSLAGRLKNVSLQIPLGALAGLVGPNGSGKSSLLAAAAGVLPVDGNVLWRDRDIAKIPIFERARLTTWVPQEAHFEFGFTVRSVVAQGRFAHGDDGRDIEAALAQCDLTVIAERAVNELSGGERHRVLLARAITTGAPLQLWDEPLSCLDPRHALETVRIAHRLTKDCGHSVFFSLHDLRLAHCLDLVAVMHEGELRAFGKPTDVLTPELLLDVFGVRVRQSTSLTLELP